ncbi:uncharacterized protein [Spinacia oleracea]|uniref:Uncharacterized protein n=1 Tax=Spinacia oleracea TaxID=3562 RepID=A0ABM3R6J1_SPIOL|nr:uncharacterized protein LOC110793896 [Spinacia oleracea]XP_056691226.1 uncharacterized protein LOC110793896 [Spinacia oleracea]
MDINKIFEGEFPDVYGVAAIKDPNSQFLAAVEAVLVLVAVYPASPGAAARVLGVGCTPDLVCSAGSALGCVQLGMHEWVVMLLLCTVWPYVLLFTFVVFVMFGC